MKKSPSKSKAMMTDMRRDKRLGIKQNSPMDKKMDKQVMKSGKPMPTAKMKQMMKGAKPLLTIRVMAKPKKK